MPKLSLGAVCLMLLVALSADYETEAQTQPQTVVDRLDNTFPSIGKDFEPYLYKGLLDFVGELETKCPVTPDFKDFFANLRDYIVSSFKLAPPGSTDMSRKATRLSNSMSVLRGTKETSVYYYALIDSLVSLQNGIVEMQKNTWNKITLDQGVRLWSYMTKWFSSVSFFVKEAAEKKGKTIDLTNLGISTNDPEAENYKATANQTESFSLFQYMKSFPTVSKDFDNFAYKGMYDFLTDLKAKCPKSKEFNDFFEKLWDYMVSFQSVTPDSFSMKVDNNTMWKSKSLFRAMSALNGTGGTLDPWRLVGSLSSMGNALVETRKGGAAQITFERKRELTWSIVNWARAVSVLLKTASAKKGVNIDISSFETYYYGSVLIPSSIKSPPKGGNVPKPPSPAKTGPPNGKTVPKGLSGAKTGPPNGGNVPKDASAAKGGPPSGGNVPKGATGESPPSGGNVPKGATGASPPSGGNVPKGPIGGSPPSGGNVPKGATGASPPSGGNIPKGATGGSPPNGGNVPKGTSAN